MTAAAPHAARAAADLRTIREQWGTLLAAIEDPPAGREWPPAESRGWLDTDRGHGLYPGDKLVVADRAPLTLRDHPAPANLDALDTALSVERDLFDLADTLAAAVQRPGPDDPRRWRFPDPGAPDARRAAGSRAHGLHWAALFVEGRVLDEDTEPGLDHAGRTVVAPFLPCPEHLLHEAARVARACARRMRRALAADTVTVTRTLPTPCPACGGALVLRAAPAAPPTVTCRTGEACGAETGRDARKRRVWEWPGCLPLIQPDAA